MSWCEKHNQPASACSGCQAQFRRDMGLAPSAFDAGRARREDPDTSKLAAKSVAAGSYRAAILEDLRQYPGSTMFETADRLGLPIQTISPRYVSLRRQGLIVADGKKRNAATGALCTKWRLA